MMKGLHLHAVSMKSDVTTWIQEDSRDLARQDEIRATTQIILHLIDYMERNRLSQTELAKKLNVTPQYIHKLLHGQESSFRVETAIEYGKKLGISLIEIPPIEPSYNEVSFSKRPLFPQASSTMASNVVFIGEIKNVKSKKRHSWEQNKKLAFA